MLGQVRKSVSDIWPQERDFDFDVMGGGDGSPGGNRIESSERTRLRDQLEYQNGKNECVQKKETVVMERWRERIGSDVESPGW